MAETVTKHETNMTSGPIFKKLVVFAIPLILTNMLQLLFNAADIAVLGVMPTGGDKAVAAVGSTTSLINLIISLFIGLASAAQVILSNKMGARDIEGARRAVGTSAWVSILGGILLAGITIPCAKTFLQWMQCPETIIDMATRYLIIYFAGMPIIMLYNFLASVMRAVGDSVRPMVFLLVGGVVNVGLNVFFMAVFKMNVEGVAIATLISQLISAVGLLIIVTKSNGYSRLDKKYFKIYKSELKDIIRIGLPAGLQGSLFSISNVLIQSTVNSFGDLAVTGNAAAAQLDGFIYQAGHSIALACMTFVSQNAGAGKVKRIKRVIWVSALFVAVSVFAFGMTFALLGRVLTGIITDNPIAIDYAMERIWILAPTYFMCGIMEIVSYSMRALGKPMTSMVISLLGSCVFRILWLATIWKLNPTFSMIFYSYPISWIITASCLFIFLVVTIKKMARRFNRQNNDTCAENCEQNQTL